MLKLIDTGTSGNETPRTVGFECGDIICIRKEDDCIKISVTRNGRFLFLGNNHYAVLRTPSELTPLQAWPIVDLFLQANWILAGPFEESNSELYVVVSRIATCLEEMGPCCEIGGNGRGGDHPPCFYS
ncbi:MAG: hypothetical protein UX49_C0018G0021 [Candidatus Wolfebacteria bacterium GW2011_GWC2_46_275]|uniref:Uncharacterized protein n=2 Tax=Candidatus Wolfeibacteriota TaxID=1752735 RepID=A0A0G1U6J5_9BACT|nr:MAG: hypothetical protein UX70_C0001G0334 [Candidatus Wolfebacteria bacterium GW2011_GWB1_47_1]KKU36324.1 MAG: hypothetical protein UX49_C0018G0021 [Candidatus Wolfebacteria bacterium GW2011_GWC2_46_275]KKU41876.1 MAG: hypothetical protein UX58_C0005G0026 [Candidatus Wolfebacteria bacterium GW2011_GWB2_46_69]KKU54153.1 MAG: hypothetical protein UX76_C0005G0026 [Candidatus Wolfebacteria bacterium GW2011_GWC1_47_103]KKU59076.1 MAG: hypothetical protein UX83_C0008G0026 [Candidatus Wolfebacteria